MFSDMIRSALMRRLLASVGLVLLVMGSAADVFGRHACPHHDGPIAAQLERHGHAADAHGAEPQGAGSAGDAWSTAAHGHAAPAEPTEAHGCTCVGECVGTPTVALPERSGVLQQVSAVALVQVHPAYDALIARERPPYFHPWSNAPPTLV